jgi:hypothetical protein
MAVALLPLHNFFASLQGLMGWLAAPRRPALAPARPVRTVDLRHAVMRKREALPLRPLRVVRVVDGSRTQGGAGRMVISGRFADVCAELDRLAAQEARGR